MADQAPQEPQLRIISGGEFGGSEDRVVPVLVKVDTPAGTIRTPSDICCVIDVSGSMGSEATIQSQPGTTESHGLSLLDVAKHGVLTVMKTLGPGDRLAVIKFSDAAESVFGLTTMDEEGKARVEPLIEGLAEGGGTNIWKGLHAGLEVLKAGAEGSQRLSHVMLLTDGFTEDRAATVPNLKAYRASLERLPGTISTFGFGYNIDSQLLVDLAREGDGTFSFIPDAGFVGTVFVNTLSNLLVTMAREVYLDLEIEPSSLLEEVVGQSRSERTGDQVRVSLGTLQYGQSKDTVLRLKATTSGEPAVFASLRYQTATGETRTVGPCEAQLGAAAPSPEEVEHHVLRCDFVDTVQRCIDLLKTGNDETREKAKSEITELAQRLMGSKAAENDFVKALMEDVGGQTTAAFSRPDWYSKWGQHYMPSIQFAHQVQQCNNFKDPSVQLYGGELFHDIQETADAIFNSLPPPKPSLTRYGYYGGGHAASAASPQLASMAAYNNPHCVCIDAAAPARLTSGEVRRVGDLVKGDLVEAWGGNGQAEVVCVVRTACRKGRTLLCTLSDGARVTPHHPVYIDGEWRFPVEVAKPEELPCEAVCSLVLKGAPALLVAGVPCAALGHGIEEGAARHPYFGSQKVLDDLAGARGFDAGLVELDPDGANTLRDPETGLVCGLRF